MFRKAVCRVKILGYRLAIGKKSLRAIVGLASGNSGVVLYNRSLRYLELLMGTSKDADKLFKRVRDIVIEIIVLAKADELPRERLVSVEEKVKAAFERLRENCPNFPTDSHQKAVFSDAVQPLLEQFITEVTSILDEELKPSLARGTLKKLHRVSYELSQPNVLGQICSLDSPSNAILRDILPTNFQPTSSTSNSPEIEHLIRKFRGTPSQIKL